MTGDPVTASQVNQWRLFYLAAIKCNWTARVETATGWRVQRTGDIASQYDTLALEIGIGNGNSRHQCLGVGMLRVAI